MDQKNFIHQLGNRNRISSPPQRIISLVPSQTEFLADLELEDRVVGITKFCVHPEAWRKTKTIIGGTKNFDVDKIRSLRPDLIICNKEENYEEGIVQLQSVCPVWMSDIVTLQDSYRMMEDIGDLTDTKNKASDIVSEIKISLFEIQKLRSLRTLYLIWKKPWMGAASGTFINEMMTVAGFANCLENETRYPELTSEAIRQLNPELILLSSEPYPFNESHFKELTAICPDAKIVLVDGEMFSWYGSRLLKFAGYVKYLKTLL